MKEYKRKARGYKPLLLTDTLLAKDPDLLREVKTSMADRVTLDMDPKKAREMTSSGPITRKQATVINYMRC